MVEIKTTTLDNFLQKQAETRRVDLIIMDVQGAEGLVMEGGRDTLRTNDLKIIMELWPRGLKNLGFDPGDALRRLEDQGFEITVIDEAHAHADLFELVSNLENQPNMEAAVNILLEKISSPEPVKQ